MKRLNFRLLLLFPSALLALGLLSFSPPKKKLKGTLHQQTGLFDAAKGKTCRLDSAEGTSIRISAAHVNPQFASKAPNVVHLMVHWKHDITAGTRYQLPHPDIQVCYWEKGDILMFHTFKAEGWIEFTDLKPEKGASGKLELKLVQPHHNFSNSDYHFLGGNFRLLLQ